MSTDHDNNLLLTSKDYIEEIVGSKGESTYDPKEPTEISEFFAGNNVLVTGGSGFLGKLLIEKLLRSCPKLGKLYMFMRPKKGKTPEQRFKDHFDDVLYDRLRREQPKFIDRVVMIEGDTGANDLGLSAENREMLRETTNIIFHCAATVRFDEKLKSAVNINVRGTKLMILFASQMPNIKAFVHISTAFSNCTEKLIEEKYYEPPMDAEKMLSLVDLLDDDLLQELSSKLLGKWPNTYAFSKALGEEVIKRYSDGIPTCIVRPSIMIATKKEPISGWINNYYGPTGVVMGAAIGLLRTLHCESEKIADIIPADYVINNVIVACWDVANTWDKKVKESLIISENDNRKSLEPPIYNCVSSCQRPINWGRFMELNEKAGIEVPSAMVIWHYMFFLNRHLWVHNICVLFLHIIPGIIVDNILKLTGREPILLNAYKKIHKFSGVISYFCTQQWSFTNDNVLKLWARVNPADQKKFDFNLESLNWEEYFITHVKGLRVYILKDPLTTIDIGRVRNRQLKIAHYTILTFIGILLAWGLLSLLKLFI